MSRGAFFRRTEDKDGRQTSDNGATMISVTCHPPPPPRPPMPSISLRPAEPRARSRRSPASTITPCATAPHRSSSSRRTRPRWRAGRKTCSAAAFPTSWPSRRLLWSATPMPDPIGRGRPIAGPSRISIYVDPALHGRGIGRALLERLIVEAESRGFRQMIAVIGDSANTGRSSCIARSASGWSARSTMSASSSAAGSTAC